MKSMMRYGLGGMGMLGAGLVGLLVAAVLTALTVLAIIALVRYIRLSGRQNHEVAPTAPAVSVNSSLQILDERFAKGEIDEEEYTKKKELLKKG
jgi:putative membrane protein